MKFIQKNKNLYRNIFLNTGIQSLNSIIYFLSSRRRLLIFVSPCRCIKNRSFKRSKTKLKNGYHIWRPLPTWPSQVLTPYSSFIPYGLNLHGKPELVHIKTSLLLSGTPTLRNVMGICKK